MGLKKNNPGCGCCEEPSCGTIVANVRGCSTSVGVAGAIVTLKRGTEVLDVQTSPASGRCDFPIDVAGTHTLTVVPPAGSGFVTPSAQTFSAACTGSSVTTRQFNLIADANHICCLTACNLPIPRSLTISDGTFTMPLVVNATRARWGACRVYTANTLAGFLLRPGGRACGLDTAATIQAPIGLEMDCPTGALVMNVNVLSCSGTNDIVAGTCGSNAAAHNPASGTTGAFMSITSLPGTVIVASCEPFAASLTIDLAGAVSEQIRKLTMIWGPSVTFTVAEVP